MGLVPKFRVRQKVVYARMDERAVALLSKVIRRYRPGVYISADDELAIQNASSKILALKECVGEGTPVCEVIPSPPATRYTISLRGWAVVVDEGCLDAVIEE
ncbi:MAG: hypothetical protein UX69_C0001G0021 [candidate division WWE3 bacterium GW2011_GWA2_46_9]|uniref:Uncharacterized protein n=2 Tax=Katanobacteria TaxID=422282 RepID=A0A0G1QX02_UNCKA|nr:MAG: hypothetical protein UX69_C0001G0021 [candidate division WWE3 bacterium GW2011_GWA2_46_9]KKU50542.1 MAG: hypothetical protein UX73_C0021G0011 [candidate division WWE3 bacterium GW2011_GWC1_47_10]